MSIIKDVSLAPYGQQKIEWVKRNMPILNIIEDDFIKNRYFEGINIAMSIHLEAKTAYLAKVLASGGANVCVTGSNPMSTQDDVAAALVRDGLEVFGIHDISSEEYEHHLNCTLDTKPNVIIDDGGDLVHLLHSERTELLGDILGGCEETTTGVIRLHARARENKLRFPMIAVNDADCKHLFDNRYGTGQSVWDGINRTTNLIVSGKNVVIAGYGWCGKGCAMRAKGLGANVIVCEVDPIKAIEAVMDGFRVMTMHEAALIGDFFITVTGCTDVITSKHFELMKDGAILANAGHFDVEVSVKELQEKAVTVYEARKNIMGYKMPNGKTIFLLARGRLVNLASGDGHPAEIMDMSFSIMALCAKHIVKNYAGLKPSVYGVPKEIDRFVGKLKINSMGIIIDELTCEQERYLQSYQV